MPTYLYEAVNQEGKIVRGLLEADSEKQAIDSLKKNYRLQVRHIQVQTKLSSFIAKLQGVSQSALAIFTREFSTMVDSGLPFLRCMEILSTKGDNQRLENVLLLIREHMRNGESLLKSFARYPDVFDPVYLAMIKAGEVAGDLSDVLDRLANYLEKTLKITLRVRSTLIYPTFVFSFCVLLCIGLAIYILPKFVELFDTLKVKVPFSTRILIFVIHIITNPFAVLLLACIVLTAIYLFLQYIKTPIGRRQFDQWVLSTPLVGTINRKIAISRFCRTFSTLFSGGIPVLQALQIVSQVSGNEIINDSILQVQEAVRYGSSISAPLEESGLFPPLVTNMIQVGEQTGHLHNMLLKVSDYYDLEVELALDNAAKLVEPLLIIFIGSVVGFVLVSILLPLYQLVNSFGQ